MKSKIRRRLSALAALLALVSMLFTVTPAQAAEPTANTVANATATTDKEHSGTADIGPTAWFPNLTPLYPEHGENVGIKMTTESRNAMLHSCARGYVCVAAGRGDGYHNVFILYSCTQRTLTDFIGDGAIMNNQTDNATVILKDQNGTTVGFVGVHNPPSPFRVRWDPVYYLDPC
ncbi:hypothetical protein E1286_43885 [Nonomuraea terrae]|uniref:Secreted protein n=1 Tax=Nonomuraea terrae TaxID=2530383 RepID=A0A4R4XMC3_9ACTN|nr:hypothetical protein [Nonomuraea terrae]TDD32196.1 hypothetical protein E1286_43885 [Nonomuraea terrae]